MNANIFHGLAGKSICFKELSVDDTAAVHSYASDEDVSRFIGWKLMNTLDETREFMERMISRESAGTHYYANVVL